jgi:hypothetical protein
LAQSIGSGVALAVAYPADAVDDGRSQRLSRDTAGSLATAILAQWIAAAQKNDAPRLLGPEAYERRRIRTGVAVADAVDVAIPARSIARLKKNQLPLLLGPEAYERRRIKAGVAVTDAVDAAIPARSIARLKNNDVPLLLGPEVYERRRIKDAVAVTDAEDDGRSQRLSPDVARSFVNTILEAFS